MPYQDVVNRLSNLLDNVGISYSREFDQSLDILYLAFPALLRLEIEQFGYIGDVDLPWTAESLSIYSLSKIDQGQAGYRYDTSTGRPDPRWDAKHYVIADARGDPITIEPTGAIYFARHGEGSWQYNRIALNLESFLDVLAKWTRFFLIEKNKNIFTEDFSFVTGVNEEVSDTVLNGLDQNEKDNMQDFLFG